MGWVYHGDGVHVRQEIIVNLPGVGGHFDHYRVLRSKGLAAPVLQISPGQASRAINLDAVWINANGDQVVLVDIEAKKAGGR